MNAKRSGLTPNESSIRTGLTPGVNMFQNSSLYSYFPMAPNSQMPMNGSSLSVGSNNTNNTSITNTTNNTNNTTNTNNNNASNIIGVGSDIRKPLSTGLTGFNIPTLGNLDVNTLSNLDPGQTHQDMNNANIKGGISVDGQAGIVDGTQFNRSHKSSTSTTHTTTNNIRPTSDQASVSPASKDTIIPLANSSLNVGVMNESSYINEIPMPRAEKGTTATSNTRKRLSSSSEVNHDTKRAKSVKMEESSPNLTGSPESVSSVKAKSAKSKKKAPATEEEKRQNFLERNRVAASKCRQRKKEMIENMKYDLEEYKAENKLLRDQVGTLREHALTLRTILYAHRDCSLLIEQVGGIQSLNTILNATNYVAQIPEAHQSPENINADEVPQLLNGSGTNVQAAVAAAVAHTTNKAIERQGRLSTSQ